MVILVPTPGVTFDEQVSIDMCCAFIKIVQAGSAAFYLVFNIKSITIRQSKYNKIFP
jgi:hypothetical protein